MATRGDVLDNGNIRMRFLQTTRDTQGALVEVEATYRPGSTAPPRHVHPLQEERFEVREGAIQFEVDGVLREVRAGDGITVPKGAVHRAWNAGTQETKVIWATRPALETELFFEALGRLNAAGLVDARGRPGLQHVALLTKRFDNEWRIVGPPRIVQSCVFGILAPLAHLTGAAKTIALPPRGR